MADAQYCDAVSTQALLQLSEELRGHSLLLALRRDGEQQQRAELFLRAAAIACQHDTSQSAILPGSKLIHLPIARVADDAAPENTERPSLARHRGLAER